MTNTIYPSLRPQLFMGFLFCTSLMLAAIFMQYAMEMEPCPLCILQRVVVIALGAVFLIAALHNPMGLWRRIYATLLVIISLMGIGVAGRHVWLQHLPADKVPECGPGLAFWMDRLSPNQLLMKILEGSGDCAKVSFKFLGLSIPEWLLITFILLLAFCLKILLRNR